MSDMLERKFGGDPRVAYVNLGNAVDVSDPELSFDRMHLTFKGNDRIASALVEPVARVVERARARATTK